MADTRKEKLQAMLDAIEASKANMGKQQLMEVLRKKEAAKQSIIPEDMRREPEYDAAPATVGESQRTDNLPYMEGSEQVIKPLPYSPSKKEKKTRLYRMMQ